MCPRLGLGEGVLYNWVRKSKAADGSPLGDMREMQAVVANFNAALRCTTEERDIRAHECCLYLAVVLDLHSRAVVGWSIGSRMQTGLVLDALTMAV